MLSGLRSRFRLPVRRRPESLRQVHITRYETMLICWMPTFEPFEKELPKGCDWISFGMSGPIGPEFDKLADRWKRLDDKNQALLRLVPEDFVRSRLIDHVSKDLVTGTAGQWDVSVDRFHGRVIGARLAGDATAKATGFALPNPRPSCRGPGWGRRQEDSKVQGNSATPRGTPRSRDRGLRGGLFWP